MSALQSEAEQNQYGGLPGLKNGATLTYTDQSCFFFCGAIFVCPPPLPPPAAVIGSKREWLQQESWQYIFI